MTWCENCQVNVDADYDSRVTYGFCDRQYLEEKETCPKCGKVLQKSCLRMEKVRRENR